MIQTKPGSQKNTTRGLTEKVTVITITRTLFYTFDKISYLLKTLSGMLVLLLNASSTSENSIMENVQTEKIMVCFSLESKRRICFYDLINQ